MEIVSHASSNTVYPFVCVLVCIDECMSVYVHKNLSNTNCVSLTLSVHEC